MRRLDSTWVSGARVVFAGLLALASGCAEARSAPHDEPDCTVARVGDDVVTVRDAEVLRAVLQPPPTRGEAKRLAVSATAAYRQEHPSGALAAMDERLIAYRQAIRGKSDLAALPVQPGACWDSHSAR
ncbi:hypothetical protein [Polyangium jinanense]|uniref:Lipoprotein n=1 Tax=Polyangium jinanense TaxID=2829994 RepID=A0A9X4AVE7_9BACT|nr:hypothetical protein [Polyangium jinanense]MDC3954301.1 hypothetical protein [Polyangium jinanense]MDC3984247.1 hypothetical protein [Polyangium jinanense]